ncbi:MAG: trypsin-like peptidase domain-containing protein [Spirochaetia bacterium]|nr:trypsin-like peptidase domain-containing protein [Spirochaetia bacterium]
MLKSLSVILLAAIANLWERSNWRPSRKTCGAPETLANSGTLRVRTRLRLVICLIVVGFCAGGLSSAESPDDAAVARQAVVRIDVSFFEYSYDAPYKPPGVRRASGTGFIIEGNRILTNAHVVSQANTIRLHRPDRKEDYAARIAFIAHDCDLALLTLDDPAFFKDSRPLEIGKSPELNSPVLVVGFPIGGDRVSLTRGIVSRKDMDTYAHSTVDSHATIQVDAAINPGNSGGPGLQGGKVIGVAFQSFTRGENLGYLIPPEVIGKFLDDVKDNRYDGYVDFGTNEISTRNVILREALGLKGIVSEPDTGVLVYDVLAGSSADGFIKAGDILLQINGKKISQDGEIELDGHLSPFVEMLDNLSAGTQITAQVLRDGKILETKFPARKAKIVDFMRVNYDTPPPFLIQAGHVFQPLDANLMQ